MKTVSLELGKQTPKYGRRAQEGYKGSAKTLYGVCPVTKVVVSEVYGVASSHTASKFLRKMKKEMPYIKSVQVDGGSEFRGKFEETALELGFSVCVLPPRSLRLNGSGGKV